MDSCLRRNDGEVQGGRREARTTEGCKVDGEGAAGVTEGCKADGGEAQE